VDCGAYNAQVCASPGDVQAAVDRFMHPDVTLPGRANGSKTAGMHASYVFEIEGGVSQLANDLSNR